MTRLSGTGNVILTDDKIAAEALRLLKNELLFARLVHRNLEREFGKVGDTINIKLPFRTKTASGRTLVKQPMVDRTTTLKIDKQEHFALEFTQNDRTLSISQFSERYLKSGTSQLAHVLDKSIADISVKSSFFGSGTPGTEVSTDAWADAMASMELVGVPMDGKVSTVLNPRDGAAVAKDVKRLANESLVKKAIEQSYIGPLSDMPAFRTAQMPNHTVGALGGSPLVNDAAYAGGSTIVTDGWTAAAAARVKIGDCFTLEGVYEINPRTYESTGSLQRFVATAVGTSDASGNMTISFSPAMNDGTATTVDADGNTVSLAAFQNVTAYPANNAPLTFIGTANTTYRQDVCFHKDAIALAVIDIDIPESAVVAKRVRDPQSGLSLLMTAAYDINNFSQIYRVDLVWGVKAIYPELMHRIWSDNIG